LTVDSVSCRTQNSFNHIMKLLITGSRGFVGGSLARFAVDTGHQVLGVARASQPAPDWQGGYAQADVASADLVRIITEYAPDVVFHGAGTASVGGSLAAPVDDLRAAVLTWANVLDGVRRSGHRPLVIFPSSAAIYGNPPRLPVGEDLPTAPISPYGFHKAACELLGQEYAACFGLHVLVGRVFSLYGPAQRRLLLWELAAQFLGSQPEVWLQGSGDESRDYLYIDDLCAAVLELAQTRLEQPEAARFECLNLASGLQITTLELAEHVRRIVAPEKQIHCRRLTRPGDPEHWQADVTRLRSLLPGWRPRPLTAGLAECFRAWRTSAR
jgi:UDP-glucose 4-epimerase